MNERELRQDVYAALKVFQNTLRVYMQATGLEPLFLINGAAPAIPHALLAGCRVFPSRGDIIADLPKGGIGVEVGTQTGRFARTLIDLAQPRKLYLLDINYTPFQSEHVAKELEVGTVEARKGLSWELLAEFDDNYFDFAYIDAGHGYDMVSKDLAVALRKVKTGGYIICNDFVVWSALEAIPYGVHKAVTEVIAANGFPVTHFALHPFGYFDIGFRLNSK